MANRRAVRGIAAAVLLVCVLVLGSGYAASDRTLVPQTTASTPSSGPEDVGPEDAGPDPTGPDPADPEPTEPGDGLRRGAGEGGEGTSIATADSVTVVATQGFYLSDETAELVAFDDAGTVLYYDDTYPGYFDVDPVSGRRYTVEYVAARAYTGEPCAPVESQVCTRNVVERVNLSTGERTRVYAKLTPRVYSARWHDVDRVNDTHLAVADIVEDRVYFVDSRTGEVTWQWNASEQFRRDQGGPPGDWTHINDVEVLADGRVIVSVRNMDQVVFLDPGRGVIEGWTLGADDDHDVLYEQHNPDYIPADRGGPALLVSDSENNRITEYERRSDTWERTWSWRDARLQWPRDADRLPNGHTLVVDSHGDRVLELDDNGTVVWTVPIGLPYDAERLHTGAESTGPAWRSMHEPANGQSGTPGPAPDPSDRAVLFLKSLLPSVLVNGLLFVSPSWVRFVDLLVASGLVLDLFAWVALELYWSSLAVRDLIGRFGRVP